MLFGSVLRVQSLEGSKEFDLLVLLPRGVCNALIEYKKTFESQRQIADFKFTLTMYKQLAKKRREGDLEVRLHKYASTAVGDIV